tara:strand:- start:11 stop:283 length:273 start_codon:yes stop_codon:yes gene_type:complete
LNEYPKAAQEKKVTADRSTPASRNHSDKEENISKIGTPAENPKKSMVITLGCQNAARDSRQPENIFFVMGGLEIEDLRIYKEVSKLKDTA